MTQLAAPSGATHGASTAAEVNDDSNPKSAGVLVRNEDCELPEDDDETCASPFDPIAWGPSSTVVLPVLSTDPMKDAALSVNNSVEGEYDIVGFSTFVPESC